MAGSCAAHERVKLARRQKPHPRLAIVAFVQQLITRRLQRLLGIGFVTSSALWRKPAALFQALASALGIISLR